MWFSFFSSSRAFPIIWGRHNGFEFLSHIVLSSASFTFNHTHFPYLFYKSLSTWFSVLLPVSFPVSRFEFERIDRAITSLLANQPVALESECARDQCQSAVVTLPVNLSFSFLSWVLRNRIDFIAVDSPLSQP